MSGESASTFKAPVFGALLLFAGFFAFIAIRMAGQTGGTLVYPLDDPYIHMAIAKNVATHGVWGISPDRFSATSSSPLWTALLALAFAVTGVHEATPLVLNACLAVLTIVCLGRLLRHAGLTAAPLFAGLALCVLLAPLAPMAWIGMEHTLHIFLTVLAVDATLAVIERPASNRVLWLGVLCALMVATRYEGLFVVAGCAVVLAGSGRLMAAVAAVLASVLPVLIVGLWNVAHGWFFLPASVLLKQSVLPPAGGAALPSALSVGLRDAPAAYFIVLGVAGLLLVWRATTAEAGVRHPFLPIFVIAALLHGALAKFGHLLRYESYLMVLGPLAIALSTLTVSASSPGGRRGPPDAALVLVVTLIACVVMGSRTVASNALAGNLSGHIYRQHRQVAALLGEFYDGEPVALNDIGNVSFFTRARVVDLVGLGSLDVAQLRRAGLWDRPHMDEVLRRHNVDVAIVYETWFQDDLAFHRNWSRVATWTTDVEDTPDQGTVTFFARTEPAAARLRGALAAFHAAHPQPATTRKLF